MRVAFYVSSLVSSYWNGAATPDCVPIYNALDQTTHHPVARVLDYAVSDLDRAIPDEAELTAAFASGPAGRMDSLLIPRCDAPHGHTMLGTTVPPVLLLTSVLLPSRLGRLVSAVGH